MRSKTTYVYYAIKTKILIEAYGYFGVSQLKTKHVYNYFWVSKQKSTLIRVLLFYPSWGTFTLPPIGYFLLYPGEGTFMLTISECIFRLNLRNRKSQLR